MLLPALAPISPQLQEAFSPDHPGSPSHNLQDQGPYPQIFLQLWICSHLDECSVKTLLLSRAHFSQSFPITALVTQHHTSLVSSYLPLSLIPSTCTHTHTLKHHTSTSLSELHVCQHQNHPGCSCWRQTSGIRTLVPGTLHTSQAAPGVLKPARFPPLL